MNNPYPYGTPPNTPPPKKRHWIRNILIGIGVVIAAIVVLSIAIPSGNTTKVAPHTPARTPRAAPPSSAAPSPSTDNLQGSLGDTFKVSGPNGPNGSETTYEVILDKVDQNATLGQYDTLEVPADHVVAAEFTIKGVSGQSTDDANNDASAIGNDTQDYQSSLDEVSDGGNFNDGGWNVGPGQTVSGWVTFEVPSGRTVTFVQWTPGLDGPAATWKLAP